MLRKIGAFLRREIVFTCSLAAALLSMLLTAPGVHTLQDIDVDTLCMLFGLMTTVAGLRRIGLFDRLGAKMTSKLHHLRALSMTLTAACFVLAMADATAAKLMPGLVEIIEDLLGFLAVTGHASPAILIGSGQRYS